MTPRVVLLHGWTMRGASMAPLATALPGFDCAAPDLPGHGTAVPAPAFDRSPGRIAFAVSLFRARVAVTSKLSRCPAGDCVQSPREGISNQTLDSSFIAALARTTIPVMDEAM